MIAADVATLLPDDYLVKVDRASMANGLEVRPPLLDHELLELAARIPSCWKVHKGQTKWLFKETYRPQLPPAVVDRPKRGFEMPIDAWLRGPLRDVFEAAVLAPQARVGGLVDQGLARMLYRSHLRGTGRHGGVLWSLLVLAHWAARYLGPSTAEPSAARTGGRSNGSLRETSPSSRPASRAM
jgi:asparagine synthase (glutamine-hydrolysing)